MSEIPTSSRLGLQNNNSKKKDIITKLETVLDKAIKDGRAVEEKAWDILRFTTTIFSVISAALALLRDILDLNDVASGIGIGGFFLIILYWLVFWTSRLGRYAIVPGTPSRDDANRLSSPNQFKEVYLDVSEETYLDQLIVDYVGANHPDGNYVNERGEHYFPGIIEAVSDANRKREFWLNVTYLVSFATILSLLCTLILTNA